MALITIWFQYHNAIRHDIVRTDGFGVASGGRRPRGLVLFFQGAFSPQSDSPFIPDGSIGAVHNDFVRAGVVAGGGFLRVLALSDAKWGKPFLFGLGYFVVMLLPVLGFLNISFFRFSLVADHWQYFAIVGIIALAAAGITAILNPFPKGKIFFCGALLLLLGFLTWRQASIYRDAETLCRTTLAENPDCWLARDGLGGALLKKGKVDEAIAQFQQSFQINPDHAHAHYNLGGALFQKGKVDDAIAQFHQALQINPDNADARNNLGGALFPKGVMWMKLSSPNSK